MRGAIPPLPHTSARPNFALSGVKFSLVRNCVARHYSQEEQIVAKRYYSNILKQADTQITYEPSLIKLQEVRRREVQS